MPLTGPRRICLRPKESEFYGNVNFLKAGLISADSITTVSNNYAKEIPLSREYGFGLDGVYKEEGPLRLQEL